MAIGLLGAAEWRPSGDERRRKPRVPFEGRVRLGPVGQSPRSILPAENLSAEGIFLCCAQPVRVGAQFALELDLPSGDRVLIPEVEVLYNRPAQGKRASGFGARFVDPPAAAAEKLRRVTSAWSGTERPRRAEQRGGSAATVEANESALLYAESRVPDPLGEDSIVTDPCRAPVELAPSMQIELSSIGFGSVRPAPLPRSGSSIRSASIAPTEALRSENPAKPSVEVESLEVEGSEPTTDQVTDHITDPELVVELLQIAPDAALKAALFDEPKSLTPTPEVVISRGPELVGRLDIHAALSRRPGQSGRPGRPGETGRPSRRGSSGGSMKPSRRPSLIEAAPSLVSLTPQPIEIPEPVMELPPSRLMESVQAAIEVAKEIGEYLRTHKTAVILTATVSAGLGLLLTGGDEIEAVPLEIAPVVALPAQPLVLAPKSDVAPPALASEIEAGEAVARTVERPVVASSASLEVANTVKVIRTLTLSNPPRYVLDLDTPPSTVRAGPTAGRVLGVRVGRHDGFTRVVLDLEGSVGAPKIDRSGSTLTITLD
ncbi:MAG: PilZ domain-containing protein [Deltaproteobacteria bacterium]|nr:PilZ domain-containing protein [Deltaproteobacteria bacterium]